MKHLSPAEIETIRVPEPKHDPFTLESLVAWLERQPEDGEYNWYSVTTCLMCHYLRDIFGWARPAGKIILDNGIIRNWGPSGYRDICATEPWTFGAALTRARAALASQKGNALAAARTQGSE